jgi:hypothetical protein
MCLDAAPATSRSHGTRRSFPLLVLREEHQIHDRLYLIAQHIAPQSILRVALFSMTAKRCAYAKVSILARDTTASGSLDYDETSTMLTVTGRVRSVCFVVFCVWVHSAIITCAVTAVLGAIYSYHMCLFVLSKVASLSAVVSLYHCCHIRP